MFSKFWSDTSVPKIVMPNVANFLISLDNLSLPRCIRVYKHSCQVKFIFLINIHKGQIFDQFLAYTFDIHNFC